MTRLQQVISNSENIVFFGGAGVSTESGIPDFRSVDGLYNQKYAFPPEIILSHDFFFNNTKDFYRFYRDKMIITNVKPNPAHFKLARLEQKSKLKAVITQNIDGLHQAAGSKTVMELHGSVHRNYCVSCNKFYGLDYIINSQNDIPLCSCGGIIKPDVVLYQEPLSDKILKDSINYIQNANTMIVAGTSLTVYPAASLVQYFNGDNLILINRDKTPLDIKADIVIHNSVGVVLDQITV